MSATTAAPFTGRLLRDLAHVLRAGTLTTRAGDVVADWSSPVTVATVPAFFQYRTSSEDTDHRDRQIVTARLYLETGVDITGSDRVVWVGQGITFEVVGPPRLTGRPGRGHHLEVDLISVTDGGQ